MIEEKALDAAVDVLWPTQDWNGEKSTCKAVAREAIRAYIAATPVSEAGGELRTVVEGVEAAWQTIQDQCHEGSDSSFTEQAADELTAAVADLTNLGPRKASIWDLVPAVDDAWQELCERDDRTSPAEYTDMCLITHDELADFMSRAAVTPTPGTPVRGIEKDATAFINDLVHMQSGQGWSRAIVRDAAANFLKHHSIAIAGHVDTMSTIAALDTSPASLADANKIGDTGVTQEGVEYVVVPKEAFEEQIEAMRQAWRETRASGVSGMSIDAQWRAEYSRELAAYRAVTSPAALTPSGRGGQ